MTNTLVTVPVTQLLEVKELLEQAQGAVDQALAAAQWAEDEPVDQAAVRFQEYRRRVRARERATDADQEVQ